ncbi:MAG TPA: YggS family pyridoxal phosphate-dependent enzyme [Anaerohalosphaeraceae bacterium]|nr:YggS family pyridoxal phosphate-dependent enzyme [Anaerohalosphaeraceae bacterium]HOL32428.1 YggS family pyridoxal phosphate-dependent enzyme [Anaerohalosphaeraceae bacterium]HOM75244.1 YggS family pyridoxal phosphate-dependent enzyme [Anaerohalosphaeraceae bacterium]HPC64523.1 YggS family pyridoxal phosphate-dependent enzyme [Anaerohalosphaeraceae bacterium]HPO69444.1 YggS family pyridoxal phosphate-dependent enzyme [Anaerohalosphaeraceae bacterium]
MGVIADKLKKLQDEIASVCARCRRSEKTIQTIVVTKTASIEAIHEVIRAGAVELGENRVQHLKQISDEVDAFLKEKAEAEGLPRCVNWHMIGHLQRNKVRQTLQICRIIHSVDTLRLAEEINIQAQKMGIHINVLMQVNCSGEPQKYGVPVGAAVHLAEQIDTMPNLRLIGLMTMAPLTMDKDIVRSCFARARELFEEIRAEHIGGAKFKHLSMGMSQDYPIAIEEGATMLRIGSAIFS